MAKKGVELPPFQGHSVEVICIDHSTIEETRVFISTVVEVNSNVTECEKAERRNRFISDLFCKKNKKKHNRRKNI